MDASELDACPYLALGGRSQYLGNDRYPAPIAVAATYLSTVCFWVHAGMGREALTGFA